MKELAVTALRAARLRAGMTQSQLAEQLGVSSATLSRAESGAGTLTPERARLSAELLGLPPDELLAAGRPGDAPVERGLFLEGGPAGWRDYEDLELTDTLRAALDSFVALGYHGTSVRDIARLAGLSVPGLYHHYPSKQALLVAVMELTMSDFHRRCVAARDEGTDPVARFELLVECFALFHSYRRELAFIGASEMRSLEGGDRVRIAALRAACQHLVTEEVEQIAAARLMSNPFPDDAARAVVTMLVGIANWYRGGGPLSPEQIARRYVLHSTSLIQLR